MMKQPVAFWGFFNHLLIYGLIAWRTEHTELCGRTKIIKQAYDWFRCSECSTFGSYHITDIEPNLLHLSSDKCSQYLCLWSFVLFIKCIAGTCSLSNGGSASSERFGWENNPQYRNKTKQKSLNRRSNNV